MSGLLKEYCVVETNQSCPSVYQSIAIAQGRPGADRLVMEEFVDLRRTLGTPCAVKEWVNLLDAYMVNQGDDVIPVPSKLVCKYI